MKKGFQLNAAKEFFNVLLKQENENTFSTWKEMTRTHPNQSLDNLISPTIQNSIWQFVAFP